MKSSGGGRGPGGQDRGPQNLSRAKVAVHKMMLKTAESNKKTTNNKNKSRAKVDPRESMFKGPQGLSRKERRRQAKQEKKSKMIALHSKKSGTSSDKVGGHPGLLQTTDAEVPGKNREKNKRKKINRARKLKEEQEAAKREEELAEANKDDEKTIKRLEKELNFKKNRKTKAKITPSIFKADGLDYLLDFVNADSEDFLKDIMHDDDTRGDTDSGDDSDADSEDSAHSGTVTTNSKFTSSKAGSRIEDGSEGDESEDDQGFSGDGDDFDEDEIENEEAEVTSDSDSKNKPFDKNGQSSKDLKNSKKSAKRKHFEESNSEDDSETETPRKLPEVKMDPYGNLIGEEKKATGTYIPPQKRAKMMGHDEKKQEQLDRLRKQLKGLINRLSESNVQSISGQIEELYLVNSRNDMNELLTQLIMDSCINLILTGERLVMEHVMLLAILNTNIGNEVGAHFIQAAACKLDELYSQGGNYGDGKHCDNIVLLFTHLYNFKVIHCTLVYDIIRKLVDGFTERDIEMLLLILKNAGLMLRKDDPSSLKEIILQIQTKASTCSEEFKQQSRVKFMLETIYAIRNNNVRKIPNYDPAQLDHMRKILRLLIKGKGHNDNDATLRVSLENLLMAEEKGRWWIIGSSWAGNQTTFNQDTRPKGETPGTSDKTSSLINELSRQQRMNTDLRKTIFSIVMTAEDYVDAFEKVLRLNIKGGQEREVVHVLINCCLQEATFNPYYAHLGCKLCQYDRKYKMAFQFAFWDKFKILSEMSNSNNGNLALLLSQMLVSKAVAITVLKVIEFADIDKLTVRFLRQTLRSLLLHRSKESTVAVFSAVTSLPKLRFFREGLRLFLLHFVLPKTGGKGHEIGDDMRQKLQERVKLADQTLAGESPDAPI
ncbi:nucleolar MIF4G domain-containing protein 1-like [Asterias amurensis]|uniref:nucleolar MIF4G domain-containing protein 1-like n=1 Tax=Asterias amurensis TaxID=7602 RepID=UPI003AB8415C